MWTERGRWHETTHTPREVLFGTPAADDPVACELPPDCRWIAAINYLPPKTGYQLVAKRGWGGQSWKAVTAHQHFIHWKHDLVPTEGVEPTHPYGYQILSLARLPIPPRRQPTNQALTTVKTNPVDFATLFATVWSCEIQRNPPQCVQPAPFLYQGPGPPQAPSSRPLAARRGISSVLPVMSP
jgi:hypothetical protein